MEISAYHHYQLHPRDFPILQNDKYILRLATNSQELESIFRLRFQVFNVELGLGLSDANNSQMDQDKFDDVCDHLLLICKQTGETIGTYRMQTYARAAQFLGFDAADIFSLYGIPDTILQSSVEVGRACIAKKYRNSHTLLLLWQGLANYLLWTRKQYFFGCASLLTQCHQEAVCTFNYFREHNLLHPHILVCPHTQYLIDIYKNYSHDFSISLPNIFQAYLSIGAKVCSLPAIDQQFQTIDFLIIANIADFARWKY
ncbi:GNAT family N-acetyltransferase [Anabaena sp. FACHB-1237]|uniref:GNAT family N-acetyltransferase n=1 Tax=Anabaena sp. FACHB-1237 TaxID=2692769 RepID=UPI001680178D|nr:GNAT family N-acyltransferase [Anabaena sp. FACHB-1237]MBD2139394.1 GNAT family N-acetyltransferase [Anabaena sp. FACHB-1237]